LRIDKAYSYPNNLVIFLAFFEWPSDKRQSLPNLFIFSLEIGKDTMFFYGLDGGVLNFKTNKATHNIMGNNKKYSRTLIYLLSVGISLFVLIPLGMYITPLVILLGEFGFSMSCYQSFP